MSVRNLSLALSVCFATAMYPMHMPTTATRAAHVVRVTIKRVPVHALPSTLSPVLAGRLTEGEMGVLFSDYDDKVAVKVRS